MGRLHVLAYNLANFLRRLTLPASIKHWSLTTLREKLVKIGAKVVHRARYAIVLMAEVAVPRHMYRTILRRIARLREVSLPPPTGSATGANLGSEEEGALRGCYAQDGCTSWFALRLRRFKQEETARFGSAGHLRLPEKSSPHESVVLSCLLAVKAGNGPAAANWVMSAPRRLAWSLQVDQPVRSTCCCWAR